MLLMLSVLLLLALTLFVAFANGANDVSKGIATLVGSGISSYRSAVAWGSLCTVAGALTAAFASQGLVATFSGKGILTQAAGSTNFLLATAIGAVAWLIIATLTGMPVSTTHSLTGALIGAALMQAGPHGVLWGALTAKIAVPLAASPVMALLLIITPVRRRRSAATVSIRAINALHWISSGATSFLRGLNDTPKILALGVAAGMMLGIARLSQYALVALAMGVGSIVAGFRVTRTLAEKVTRIAPTNGLAASLVTSVLVGAASRFAMPVSTTHVSSGAIVGVGLCHRAVQWKVVGEMLLAWLVTLPASALLAAAAQWALG